MCGLADATNKWKSLMANRMLAPPKRLLQAGGGWCSPSAYRSLYGPIRGVSFEALSVSNLPPVGK